MDQSISWVEELKILIWPLQLRSGKFTSDKGIIFHIRKQKKKSIYKFGSRFFKKMFITSYFLYGMWERGMPQHICGGGFLPSTFPLEAGVELGLRKLVLHPLSHPGRF